MGIPVIVYGKSGVGKSYSLKELILGKEPIGIINSMGKPYPFRCKLSDMLTGTDPRTILDFINERVQKGVKTFVIDDMGYIQTALFMKGHRQKAGGAAYELYNDIGDVYWALMRRIMALPDDVIVYMMFHETSNDYGECKIRTIGKLLDEKVCLEGLCTIVIHAIVEDNQHLFRVQASENDIAKSPEDMFPSETIPNNLKAVDTAIRNYYFMED